MIKVAIQGIEGSYHHQVAEQYFGNAIQLVPSMTFEAIPRLIKSGQAEVAVMAIENSIAGSLLPNYKLIDTHELAITGEVFLPIHHQLLAMPGQTIEAIEEVHSHPMALQQCEVFFENYPHISLVESKDTAASALKIAREKRLKVAAIASKMAGDLYALEVLAADIHTIKNNTTRFFIVQKEIKNNIQMPNKATLKLTLSHRIGSLMEVLQLFAAHQINMTKIQSLPLRETPFQYAFFIDVEFGDYEVYKACLYEVKTCTSSLKIVGEYQKNNGL